MTKIWLTLALLSCPLSSLAACQEASAGANEKWSQTAVKLAAGTAKAQAPDLPIDSKIELALSPTAKVNLVGTKVKKTEGFSGLAKLSAVNGGSYEVSLGERVWVDVIDAGTGKSVKTAAFKKGEPSKGAVKTIAFPLSAGRLYFFQVNAAKAPLLAMLVHPAP